MRDYKQGQLKGFQTGAKKLQIGEGISNWGKDISNEGRKLQIEARQITNRGRDFKPRQGLQIGAEQSMGQFF